MTEFSIPLIKEHRVEKLVDALKCIDNNPFNREKQRDCIMKLYPDKTEKSIFRGMIIPSLRHLGLIIGHGSSIRVNVNGKILIESEKRNFISRAARAIFLEIDRKKFHFVQKLTSLSQSTAREKFVNNTCELLQHPSEKQKKERVESWLKILEDCKLVETKEGTLNLNGENYEAAIKDLSIDAKRDMFRTILFDNYKSLPLHRTAGIIDITVLREIVATSYCERDMILTEFQFDKLLEDLPTITDNYVISFGKSMGAEEGLFFYRGNYYRTLSIKFFGEREK